MQRPEQLMHSVAPSEPTGAPSKLTRPIRSKLYSRYEKVDSQLSRVGNNVRLLPDNCGNNLGN
jgi:hypothetical protein